MQILKSLNDQQQKAVQVDGSVILTACPGSGKTRVLTHKIAFEASRSPDPRSWVLGLTYTNRAADEISRRIEEMGLNTDRVWVGTIHAFCLEWILQPYAGSHKRLKNGFSLIDESQADQFLNQLKKKYGLQSWEKIDIKVDADFSSSRKNQAHIKIANEYHEFLESKKLIDFDLVLFLSNELLDSSPQILKALSALFAWVCVDEYQDTQELQYSIVGKILKNGKGRYFIVGDPNQSIYHNLGAVNKAFDEIEVIFGTTATRLTLDRCYRSTQRIIEYYSKFQQSPTTVISHADHAKESGRIVYESSLCKDDIGNYIASLLKKDLSEGIFPADICVVAPTWWLVSPCVRRLRELLPDLKFDTVGKSGANKHRFNVWYKITCLLVSQSTPNRTWYRLRLAKEIQKELEIALNSSMPRQYAVPRQFLNLINSLQSKKEKVTQFLRDCFDQLEKRLEMNLDSTHTLSVLRELYLTSLQDQEQDDLIPGCVSEFRSWFHDNEGIVVSSCHGLKGEEYETVIAFGVLQGQIPHWDDIYSNQARAESNARQLLYVICSRAKRNLYLISETGRTTKKGNNLSPTTLLQQVQFSYDSN